jgi:hypothetical protein
LQENDILFCCEGVLKIADKYNVADLVAKCTAAMRENLNMDNAIDTLIIADKYSMTKFKRMVRIRTAFMHQFPTRFMSVCSTFNTTKISTQFYEKNFI